jgi:hypothetical protein
MLIKLGPIRSFLPLMAAHATELVMGSPNE